MEIEMKRIRIVKKYQISVLLIFSIVIAINSLLGHFLQDTNYYEWNWFIFIGMGSFALFVLLIHTMTLEKPRDFARLHIYEFFALSVLAVSLVLGVVLFPVAIFPDTMAIQKIMFDGNEIENATDVTLSVISIGGSNYNENPSGLQIPIYIIVAGILGAYIRYLYGYIKGDVKTDKGELGKLKKLYCLQKKIVNTLCIAAGMKYEEIRKKEDVDMVKLKHVHKNYDDNRNLIYFLPPHATSKLAEYVSMGFDKLYDVEDRYEKEKFLLRFETYFRTIKTIGSFFLAPLLAIVGWLFLDLGGQDQWQTFAIVGFSAGLSANAIIQRIWSFMGEKFEPNRQNEEKNQ